MRLLQNRTCQLLLVRAHLRLHRCSLRLGKRGSYSGRNGCIPSRLPLPKHALYDTLCWGELHPHASRERRGPSNKWRVVPGIAGSDRPGKHRRLSLRPQRLRHRRVLPKRDGHLDVHLGRWRARRRLRHVHEWGRLRPEQLHVGAEERVLPRHHWPSRRGLVGRVLCAFVGVGRACL